MTTDAEKLLEDLKQEAIKMDAWFKDDTKRENYRNIKEKQLLTLQNVILALNEKRTIDI